MKPTDQRNAGLAWPEVLFVISLLLIVCSLAIPTWLEWRNHQRTARTYTDLKVLVAAAHQYNREYRLWPVYDPPLHSDAQYGIQRPNAGVINILKGVDGPGNEGHRGNPHRIDFFEMVQADPAQLRFNDRGEVIDPWGSPYQMAFDSNYDNICVIEDSGYGSVVGEGVVIWSMGSDRKSNTERDVRSWRL